ncbi:MAG: hypothetical protein AAF808_04935 [Cyanobacteria bacterium P01_D01_bin.2]
MNSRQRLPHGSDSHGFRFGGNTSENTLRGSSTLTLVPGTNLDL